MVSKRTLLLGWVVGFAGLGVVPLSAQDEAAKPEMVQLQALAGGADLWATSSEDFAAIYVREKKRRGSPGDVVIESEKSKASGKAKPTDDTKRVFEWLSDAKDAARFEGTTSTYRLTTPSGSDERVVAKQIKREAQLGELRVGETIVRFKDGNVNMVEFSIYNRGDDGMMRKDKFEKTLKDAAALVEKLSGARAEKVRKSATSAARAERMVWRGKEGYYQLEYSFSRNTGGQSFLAEFIKLKVAPSSAGGLMTGAAKSTLADRASLPKRVKKRDSGDVLIDSVPMVDQGRKGYCAVASAERVMRYYGLEVDQHEMAQIAGSSAAGGTSSKKMTEALENVAGRLKVRIRSHYEPFDDYADYEKLIKKYNREAKKVPDARVFEIRRGRVFYMEALYAMGNPKALKATLADGAKYERFKKSVYESIDAGVPLLWSLYLGVFPEENIPQPTGGHMRLITGYNKKTDEILYSDSWGAGHEEKRMPFDDAFTMSLGLRVLIPSR